MVIAFPISRFWRVEYCISKWKLRKNKSRFLLSKTVSFLRNIVSFHQWNTYFGEMKLFFCLFIWNFAKFSITLQHRYLKTVLTLSFAFSKKIKVGQPVDGLANFLFFIWFLKLNLCCFLRRCGADRGRGWWSRDTGSMHRARRASGLLHLHRIVSGASAWSSGCPRLSDR